MMPGMAIRTILGRITEPDYLRLDTNPKRQRGRDNALPRWRFGLVCRKHLVAELVRVLPHVSRSHEFSRIQLREREKAG